MARWLARLAPIVLPLTALVLLREAAGEPIGSGAAPSPAVYFLDGREKLERWVPGRGSAEPVPLRWESVKDLSVVQAGRRLLILVQDPVERKPGRRAGSRLGLAVVLDVSGGSLVPLQKIPFEGRGFRASTSPDGRRAYVIAYEPVSLATGPAAGGDSSGSAAGRTYLHALDLEAGRVVDSSILPHPAAAVAVDPSGRRLFVSLPDRILSFPADRLVGSWFYRSPGLNLGLAFRPGSSILYAVRRSEVALFDPGLIAARTAEERSARDDDATGVVPLRAPAASLLFSDDGLLAVAYGGAGPLAILEAGSSRVSYVRPSPGAAGIAFVRPIVFPAGGADLTAACFPGGAVVTVPVPAPTPAPSETAVPPPAPAAPPAASPVPAASAPAAPSALPAPPPAAPAPSPAAAREAEPGNGASPRPATEPALRGRITGARERVASIVLYGPDNLLREAARTAPSSDGSWEIALPSPGVYRVVPLGAGGRPLATEPLFRTITVGDAHGQEGVDFEAP